MLGDRHLDTCYAALNLMGVWTDDSVVHADKLEEAYQMVQHCISALHQEYGVDHPASLLARRHLGGVLQQRGEYQQAAETLQEVHAVQVAARGLNHPDTLSTAWRLGELMLIADTQVTDLPAAAALLRKTAEAQGQALGEDHPNTLRSQVGLCEALLRIGGEGNSEEACSLVERCWEVQRGCLDENHPDLAKTMALRTIFSHH